MAKKNNITTEALKKLVGYIILAATNKSIIDDLNIAQDSVFSSYKLTQLLDLLKQENEEYANKLVANLNKLSSKTTSVIPDSSNAEPNTLYLYSADPNPTSYNQYMVLSDKTILDLGDTNISLEGYLKETDADSKYLKQVDSHSHDNKSILDTISQDKIDEWDKGGDGLIPVTKSQHEELVTNGSTTINGEVVTYDADAFYVITDDENSVVDMSQYVKGTLATSIDNSSTDTQIPTAMATRDYVTGKNPSSEMITECSNSVLKFPIGKWNIYSSSLARSLDDLPIQTGGNLEVFSTAYNTESPWTGTYRTRMYRYATYTKGEYIRYLYSGATPGVIEYDSGWQRVCTTKVPDVDVTNVSLDSSVVASGSVTYCVVNGICYVKVSGIVFSTTGNSAIISTVDLPKPKLGLAVVKAFNDTTDTAVGMFYVDTNNNSKLRCHIAKSGIYTWCDMSYPVAES